jgi:sRNA-binding protein
VADAFFGAPRQRGTSHRVWKTPWAGDPRVNMQEGEGGKAKAYQVKQLLEAINRYYVERKRAEEEAKKKKEEAAAKKGDKKHAGKKKGRRP